MRVFITIGGLFFLSAVVNVGGQETAILRSGASYPDGAEDIFIAKRGQVLLTRAASSGVFTKWDTRTGLELGDLVQRDGKPFELTGNPSLSDERKTLLIPAASGLWVLDFETLSWRHHFAFEGPNAACWDAKHNRYLVSKNQGRRNHLYTIDAARGEVTEVARLRGADRLNQDPRFDSLHFTPSGKLLGLQRHPAEFILIDPDTWLVKRNLRPELSGMNLSPMPDGSIGCFSQAIGGAGVDKFFQLFRKLDPETFEETQSNSRVVSGLPNWSVTFNVPRNFDAKHNRILVQTKQELIWLDADTLAFQESIPVAQIGKGYEAALAAAWNEGTQQIILFADRELLAVDAKGNAVSQTFGHLPLRGGVRVVGGHSTDFVVGDQRIVSVQDGHLAVSTWSTAGKILALSPDGQNAVQWDPVSGGVHTWKKGQGIAYSGRYGQGLRYKYPSEKYFQTRALEPPLAVKYSPDGKRLVVMKDFASGVYEVSNQGESGLEISEFGLGIGRGFFEAASFSADGSKIVFLLREDLFDKDDVFFLAVYDLTTNARLYTQEVELGTRLLGTSPSGEFVTMSADAKGLDYHSWENGGVIRKVALEFPGAPTEAATVRAVSSGDGRHYAIARGRQAMVVEAKSGRPMGPVLTLGDESADLAPLLDGRVLAVTGNGIELWATKPGEKLGTLSLFDADMEWVFHREDGRFDATISAQDRMYFQQGDRVLPLASLFEETFTSDLLAGLLAGRSYPKPDLTVVASAPTVKIALAGQTRGLVVEDDTVDEEKASPVLSEFIRLRIEAMSNSSMVEEIQIFQNGKRLQSSARGLFVDDDAPDGDKKIEEIEAILLPGENVFRAVAVNGLRIESIPAELSIVYERPSKESGGGVRLHLVVIGVNEYDNPKYNLNYAVTDARAIKAEMEQRNAGLFTEISSTILLDQEVSQASIIQTLQEVSIQATSRDVFMFYFAGHGVMSEGEDAEFYLVPPQVTQLYGDEGQLREKGVSASMLRDMARQIRAQKQIFILDACHSAGALQTVAMRGAAEERAIALLARSTGTHWLTATGSAQFAAEFKDLGHGAFTQAVLEGLRGSADSGEDGQVTVRELDAFLQIRVPELTREFRGAPQYPASFGYGQDFPVGVVAKQ